MKKMPVFIFLIFLIILAAIIFFRLTNAKVKTVETVNVKKSVIIDYIKATGRIESVNESIIYSKENIIIEKILVEEGEKVKKGQELLQADITEKMNAVKRARLKLEQAKIAINSARNKLEASEHTYTDPLELETNQLAKYYNYQKMLIEKEAAQREFEITKELYKIGAESLQNLNTKEDKLKNTQAQLSLARIEMEEADRLLSKKEKTNINLVALKTEYENAFREKEISEAELETAISQMERLSYISPIDGTVVKIELDDPSPVLSGEKIMTIADLEQLQVSAEVDELDAARIKKGGETIITFDAFPEKEFYGYVYKISPKASISDNKTFIEVIILINEKTNLLKLSNQVDMKIIIEKKEGILSLPLNVVHYGKPHFVWRYADGFAKRTDVNTGISNLEFIEIVNGLNEGDEVIRSKDIEIKDGERVKIK